MLTVGLLSFDDARMFDVAVVHEVFGADRSDRGVPRFTLRSGRGLDGCELVVVPGRETPDGPVDDEALATLAAAHGRGATVAALCSGAFVLAAAGLLDGRSATTHWRLAGELQRLHPRVRVDPGVLFVGGDGVWTSAGVTAGIDLCLHLVREAHGAAVAAVIARAMVTAPFRDGGQAQFIERPVPETGTEELLATVRAEVLGDLAASWTVGGLARSVAMSERSFLRHFRAATGTTPGEWLIAQRVDAARVMLEGGDAPVEEVARACGFGSTASLRLHFSRRLGVAPQRYRAANRG